MSRMTRTEFDYAIEELQSRFAGMAISDRLREAYADTLRPFDAKEVFTAIDTLARAGRRRPAPSEIAQVIHAARPKGQRPGPFLTDDGWEDDLVPANEPGWLEAAAEAKRRLRYPA